ncbi:MAG: diacylglycerol kinase [Paucimonas sp.]|jgi:dihydrofolate reductase|nr:diacylglycerol kinase [Paucimonas sp.]
MQPCLTLIVAIDAHRGIGVNNTLPWRLPEDLAHFKRTTSGHTVIMGRKTFDSIGRPLPNRRNIVITRNSDWRHEGTETAGSIEQAIKLAGAEDEIFIIGGAQIFADALPLAGKLIVTEIDTGFDCDTFFPEINRSVWKETAREKHRSEQYDCGFDFVSYIRNPA